LNTLQVDGVHGSPDSTLHGACENGVASMCRRSRALEGSDSGVGLRIPGVAEHLELALMVEAGLTPMQAITIATSKTAAALKLDDRGTLAAGKLADLVVLDADPSSQIANTTKIHAVWHRGKKAAGPVDAFTP
jgi:imidazolonepropionase-like amidohydrolase